MEGDEEEILKPGSSPHSKDKHQLVEGSSQKWQKT